MFDPSEVFQLLGIQTVQQRVHQMEPHRLQGARFSGQLSERGEVSKWHGSQDSQQVAQETRESSSHLQLLHSKSG